MSTVFLDLDGVLVNLHQGICDQHGITQSIEEIYAQHLGDYQLAKVLGIPKSQLYERMDYDFWANLDWMTDGREIFEYIVDQYCWENIWIWSSPIDRDGCCDGKRAWVRKHLPPIFRHQIQFGHDKWLGANHDRILIDDADTNCHAFMHHGGKSVLVPRPWNSLYRERHRTLEFVKENL